MVPGRDSKLHYQGESAQLMEVSVDYEGHNGEVTNFVLLMKMVKGIEF